MLIESKSESLYIYTVEDAVKTVTFELNCRIGRGYSSAAMTATGVFHLPRSRHSSSSARLLLAN
jgi:hypothetical protein